MKVAEEPGTCGRLSLILDSALLERGQLHTRLGSGWASKLGPRRPSQPALATGAQSGARSSLRLFSFLAFLFKARRETQSGLGLQAFSDLFKDFYLFTYLFMYLFFHFYLLCFCYFESSRSTVEETCREHRRYRESNYREGRDRVAWSGTWGVATRGQAPRLALPPLM